MQKKECVHSAFSPWTTELRLLPSTAIAISIGEDPHLHGEPILLTDSGKSLGKYSSMLTKNL